MEINIKWIHYPATETDYMEVEISMNSPEASLSGRRTIKVPTGKVTHEELKKFRNEVSDLVNLLSMT